MTDKNQNSEPKKKVSPEYITTKGIKSGGGLYKRGENYTGKDVRLLLKGGYIKKKN